MNFRTTISLRLGLALLMSGTALCGAAEAQMSPMGSQRENAGDALTRHLRTIADQPRNVSALLGAGKAALQLGDPQAALTFFARAEEIAPRDGRIKAGMGAAFVQMEQPHAALKFFSDATALGLPDAEFAGDRGLAYDLTGDPRRAQADYGLALRRQEDPEVRRRLALSHAISGERAKALETIDGQVRAHDRAAWRVRTFILALTGDAAEATRSAEAAMPTQAAQMRPFFAALPALKPADRAMAVHFGHFPNDGRALAAMAATQYASAAPVKTAPAAVPQAKPSRRSRAAETAARRATSQEKRPSAPATRDYQSISERFGGRSSSPQRKAPDQPKATATADAGAARRTAPTTRNEPRPTMLADARTTRPAAPQPAQTRPSPTPPEPRQTTPAPVQSLTTSQPNPATAVQTPANAAPIGQNVTTTAPATTSPAPSASGPGLPTTGSLAAVTPAISSAAQQPQPTPSAPAGASPVPSFNLGTLTQSAPSAAAPSSAIQVTDIPASSVSGEAGAAAPTEAAEAAPVPAPQPAAPGSALANIAAAIESLPAESAPAPAKSAPAPAAAPVRVAANSASKPVYGPKFEAPKAAKAEPAKKEPEAKPASAKKDDKKAADAKAGAEKDSPKTAAAKKEEPKAKEPGRHWVQIAGGANEAAMTREFLRLKSKAPKLLAARTAWTTPLRATNRLLVGPFKTPAEAQEFVNELAKLELPAFSWTSPAGQEIVKLASK